MSMGIVEMPSNLSEDEQLLWIEGFKAGIAWLSEYATGTKMEIADASLRILDDDGISDFPFKSPDEGA